MPRRPLLLLLAFVSCLCAAMGATEPISRVAQIRELRAVDAARALPVFIRGTITWTDHRSVIVIQDDSAGVWVNVREARQQKLWATDESIWDKLHEGSIVEVTGVTSAGGYTPLVLPIKIATSGNGPIPPAIAVDYERFIVGADAGLRIEVRGVVQGFQERGDGWQLLVNAPLGQFTADVARTVVPRPLEIVDAEVRLQGIAASVFNTRGEFIGPRLISNSPGDLQIEKPAAAPEDIPLVGLDQLLPFSPEPRLPHRLRVKATVIMALPGQFCYVQEGNRAVRMESKAIPLLNPGDQVEALGFVDMTRRIATLIEADVRKTGAGHLPDVIDISPKEILARNRSASGLGLSAQPHDFDGHLVRFRATLLAVNSTSERGQPVHKLTLAHGDMILSATQFSGDGSALLLQRPGSELEVTGIAQLTYPAGQPHTGLRPAGVDVILRNVHDVIVLRAPSWWTTRRLLFLVAGTVIVLLGALTWAWQLRRQVRRKTQELGVEMRARRDAAIEFDATIRERNRLSANLHDTLLQTMSGLIYQLEACEAESLPLAERPANHLETARRMVQRGQEDLRGTVWALRVLPLENRDIADAIRTMADRLSEGYPARVSVESARDDVPGLSEFVAGNLLLVAQEAIHNALKHSQAATIVVTMGVERDDRIVLTIRDDGIGFSLKSALGKNTRHFGLVGMRERIERLGGTFEIKSAPGQGTTIRATVSLKSYDEDVA